MHMFSTGKRSRIRRFMLLVAAWTAASLVIQFLVGSNIPIKAYAEEDNTADVQLFARNAILLDGETGDILYDKCSDEHRPNASTTKILTCILAIECGNLADEVTASSYASKMPEVRLGVHDGEKYTLENMLYAMMLESYNDAAVVIAEHIGGSVQHFAEMMNAKAEEIGCHSTYFITPNGLDAQDENGVHGTSAEDLVRIMRYCILISPQKDEFLKITRTKSYTFTDNTGNRTFACINHNAFLDMMPCALSGKTGFTCDAGYCYIGAAEVEGHTYIWALLGCGWPNNKTYKWKDSRALVAFAQEHTVYTELKAPAPPDIRITYSSGSSADGSMATKCSLNRTVTASDTRIQYVYKVADTLKAPVHKGAVAGSLEVYLDDELIDVENVIVSEDMADVTFKDEIIKVFRRASM